MTIDEIATVARGAVWLIVLVVVLPLWRRHPLVALAACGGLAATTARLYGDITINGYIGVPLTALIGWLLVNGMRKDHRALGALLGAREAEWSKQRHELVGDLGRARLEAQVLRARLDHHNISNDDIPAH